MNEAEIAVRDDFNEKWVEGVRRTGATAAEMIEAARKLGQVGRNVTSDPERYALYRLCECTTCGAKGKLPAAVRVPGTDGSKASGWEDVRCPDCRGEGRTRDLIATCGTPEALGVAIVTLAREGEWEGCPLGVLDTLGEKGERWLVRPWTPSARNVSDAARVLAKSKKEKP